MKRTKLKFIKSHTKLKLRKGRALIAVIILGLLGSIIFPKITAALIVLGIIIIDIILFIKEWKAMLLTSAIMLSFAIFDNSVINTVMLGFFFNVVFINLSFTPKWNRTKYEIKHCIDKEPVCNKVIFNESFFERYRDREKTIDTMFFYAMSILPYITLNVLQNQKAFLFNHFSLIKPVYSIVLHIFRANEYSPVVIKRIVIGIVLAMLYIVIVTLIILFTKESRLTLNEIKAKNNRDKTYWNGIELDIDEDFLIFIDVVDTSIEKLHLN